MRQAISTFLFLLTLCAWAQGQAGRARKSVIQRVKALPISSLDLSLPKVGLEFFLEYESKGAHIEWAVNECGNDTQNAVIDHHSREPAMCVTADIDLKDRAVAVVVSISSLKSDVVGIPAVFAVRVTYPGGTIHRLRGLSDLPVELQRQPPKGPIDLPPPVSGAIPEFSSVWGAA
jgi:hypothetical protein